MICGDEAVVFAEHLGSEFEAILYSKSMTTFFKVCFNLFVSLLRLIFDDRDKSTQQQDVHSLHLVRLHLPNRRI